MRVSSSARGTLGYEPEALIGSDPKQFVHRDDTPTTTALRQFWDDGEPKRSTVHRSLHRDGHWIWLETSVIPALTTRDGNTHGIALSRDVTRQKVAEEELRESAERYSVVIEANGDTIVESDMNGRLRFATPNVSATLGYTPEALAAQEPFEGVHPDDAESLRRQFRKAIEDQKPARLDAYRSRHKDGSWRWLQSTGIGYTAADGEPCFLNVTRDITERLEALQERIDRDTRTEQLRRLESLGVMAGGAAHDFNNLLTPIIGETALALADLPEDSRLEPRLRRIIETARRAGELVRPLLGYLGAEDIETQPVRVSSFVADAAEILESTIGDRGHLRLELDPEDPQTLGDPSSLLQVLMNLVTNAVESSPGTDNVIAVRTGRAALQTRTPVLPPEGHTADGTYAFIEVEDRGQGMSPVLQTRVFEPFFTTKVSGRGLGLASVLGVLRSHGGGVEIHSKEGEGTRVRALIPVADEVDLPEAAASVAAPGVSFVGNTVLVVDDDLATRELLEDILVRGGLRILTARDGAEAVARLMEEDGGVDLVLLDRRMPGQSCEVTLDQMWAIDSALKITLMSGFAARHPAETFVDRPLSAFLAKPFSPEELLASVQSVIDSKG